MIVFVGVVFFITTTINVSSLKFNIGSTKDCGRMTSDQAKYPVEYSMVKADQVCCVMHASRTSNITAECCVPPGKECTLDPDVPCCNQLSCVPEFNGSNRTICKQPHDLFVINKIKEDRKGYCADPRKPLHVLLDFTIKVRIDKQNTGRFTNYTLKDISYCCDSQFRGRSKVLNLEKYCCGTAFAICDDLKGTSKFVPGARNKLNCCGDPKMSKRESNCGAFVDLEFGKTIAQEEEQNRLFLSKKTGKSVKDIPIIPMPGVDAYGFCHYIHAGRFDVTRDLAKNPGSDIFALCKETRSKKCPKEKKFMYQFQDDTNICCTKGSHMHDSDEDHIHMDCCINNYNTEFNPTHVNPFMKHGHDFCDHLKNLTCCSGTCKKIPKKTIHDDGSVSYGGNSGNARCTMIANDTFSYCGGDYLFDPSDADYAKAASYN